MLQKLKLLKAGEKNLVELVPLAIEDKEKSSGVSGFKEVWDTSRAKTALKKESLYEAGGNLAWVSAMSPPRCPVDPLLLTTVSQRSRLADA